MKIKILTSCSGHRFSFAKGETAEVETYIGKDLIGCGFAEAVKEPAKQGAKAAKENAGAAGAGDGK